MTRRLVWMLLALGALSCDDTDSGAQINLQITALVCTSEGGDAVCDVTVENDGDIDAGGFRVGLYTGGEPSVGDSPAGTALAGPLEPLESEGVTLTAPGAGGATVWAFVDDRDDIDETFEDDNTASSQPLRR